MPTNPVKRRLPQERKKPGRPAKIDKGALLDVAERLFSEQGFSGTTTRDIAGEMGCNLALISYYFDGKEGLYRAVILRYFERSRDRYLLAVREAELQSDEGLQRLWPELREPLQRRFCSAIYSLGHGMVENQRMQRILCRELMNGARHMIEALLKLDSGVGGLLRKEIEGLVRQRRFREGLDLRYAVVSLISPFVYTCMAGPLLKELYGFKVLDEQYVRQLSIHLTRTVFEGWQK